VPVPELASVSVSVSVPVSVSVSVSVAPELVGPVDVGLHSEGGHGPSGDVSVAFIVPADPSAEVSVTLPDTSGPSGDVSVGLLPWLSPPEPSSSSPHAIAPVANALAAAMRTNAGTNGRFVKPAISQHYPRCCADESRNETWSRQIQRTPGGSEYQCARRRTCTRPVVRR
jgi:hypothetical protein